MGTSYVVLIFLFGPTFGMINYCRDQTFDKPTNMELLHFSKENSDREFGILEKFKCLHCCSHGYRSIEWFKDGQPYPWSTDISTLIVHPESANQTICSQQSTPIDSGHYWCIVRNDTHFIRHEVLLQISEPAISMGWPKTTYRPRDQKANHGDSVRFYCEAFVGTIDLPDFRSEITWERYDLNQSFIDGKRVVQQAIFREEQRVLGSYLNIHRVTYQDYGEYTCKVRNLGDQVVSLSAWLRRKEEDLLDSDTEKELRAFVYLVAVGVLLVGALSTATLLRIGFARMVRKRRPDESNNGNDNMKEVLVIYPTKNNQESVKAMTALQGYSFCSYSVHPLNPGFQTTASTSGETQIN